MREDEKIEIKIEDSNKKDTILIDKEDFESRRTLTNFNYHPIAI